MSDNCPRCTELYAYGCACTSQELSEWMADRIVTLEAALVQIDQIESTSYSLRDSDINFKKCGKIAREILVI